MPAICGTVSANPVPVNPVFPGPGIPVNFFLYLFATWLIEVPVLIILLRVLFSMKSVPVSRIIFAGMLSTALTFPVLRSLTGIFSG